MVTRRTTGKVEGTRSLLQCETAIWRCEELEGMRCGYYGDDLKVKMKMRRKCAECIEMKGK